MIPHSMLRHKKKLFLGGFALLAVLLVWLAAFGASAFVQGRMEKFLARHGVGGAAIASYGHGSGGQIVFSDIRLDRDGFSTIDSITARMRWPFSLLSEDPFSEFIIGRLTLTGEIDNAGNITFAGLTPAALLPLAGTDSLIMNAGQADLSTPIGALRLEAKLRMTRQPDSSQKIEAALWSKQYQMELDTRWNGQVLPDGKWNASMELREARFNLAHFNCSRMNGWLSGEGTLKSFSSLAGQIEAGQARLGDKTSFGNLRAALEGPPDSSHIILHGAVSAYKDMLIAADIRRTSHDWQVHASVEAKKVDDILLFLHNLRTDMQLAVPHSAALTTLLITPGNLDRMHAEAEKVTYDSAELVIDGPTGNLKGRIILRWNGAAQTGVISLNPGDTISR